MTKNSLSHQQNNHFLKHLSVTKAQEAILGSQKSRMLDPNILPFFEDWKSQNNHSNNALKPASVIDFADNPDIIENNEFVSEEVPSFYLDEEYVKLCKNYNIPYKDVYHSYRELDTTEELIADYVDLLKSAKNLCIYWDESNYNPERLQELIDEYHSEEAENDYFADLRSDRWAYCSNKGVL